MTHVPGPISAWRRAYENCDVIRKGRTVLYPVGGGTVQPEMLPMVAGYNMIGIGFYSVVVVDNTCAGAAATISDWFGEDLYEDLNIRRPDGAYKYNFRHPEAIKFASVVWNEELINTQTPLGWPSGASTRYESWLLPVSIMNGTGIHYMEIESSNITGLAGVVDAACITVTSINVQYEYYYSQINLIDWSVDSHSMNMGAGLNDVNNDVSEADTFLFLFSNQTNVPLARWFPYLNAASNIDDVDWADPKGSTMKTDGHFLSDDNIRRYWEEYHTFFPYQSNGACLWNNTIKKNPGLYTDMYTITFYPNTFFASRVSRMQIELTAAEASTHISQFMVEPTAQVDAESPSGEIIQAVYPSDSKVSISPTYQGMQTVANKATKGKGKNYSLF